MCRLAVVLMLLVPPAEAYGQLAYVLRRDLKDLEAWAREDTNDARRTYYLGLAHWRQHHWRQADSLLRLAMAMEPRYPEAYLALASLPYARRTKLRDEEMRDRVPEAWRPAVKEARELYQRAFRTDPMVNLEIMGIDVPEEPQALNYNLRDYQIYLRYYAWAVDLAMGRYLSARERLASLAEQEFDESKHPDKVPDYILWYRGLAAAHSGQYARAIPDFRALLNRTLKQQQRDEVIPVPLNDNEYRFMLAVLHDRAGNTDSAVALYQESLEHDLGLVMAHSYLASIHEQAGRDSAALLERQRAVEVSSEDPAVLF
ncbi:MAG TPA: tetratricopeptide repeat protein, partial [Gemmatimonadales bacterium]|nr:tetratricopeptide repeat protein [Gemmatimonadales bacterium]